MHLAWLGQNVMGVKGIAHDVDSGVLADWPFAAHTWGNC